MPGQPNRKVRDRQALEKIVDAGLDLLSADDLKPSMPCPDSETFALYVQGRVGRQERRAINQHIAFCSECYSEYLALADPEEVAKQLDVELQHSHSAERGLSNKPFGAMTKTGLVRHLAGQLSVDNGLAAAFLEHLEATVIRETKRSGVFILPGLGRFETFMTQPRLAHNPQTGQPIKIPSRKSVKFRVSPAVRNAILGKRQKRNS